jgi:Dna[CI] antecedent, DciA
MPGDHDERINQLREWRNRRAPRDTSLSFLPDQFQRQIARPFKQLGELTTLWTEHVPAELAARTALRSFARGTLNVCVADSATLYQLDRALRDGLEKRLRQSFKGTLQRVKLEVDVAAGETDGERSG